MKSPYIAVAVKAARRAASEITRAATSLDTLEVENKSVNDFVTAADRAAAKRGEYGMLPHDILSQLGRIFAENHR